MRVDGGKIASESIEISPEALREEASAARAERLTLQVVDSFAKVTEMKELVGSIQEFERLDGIL